MIDAPNGSRNNRALVGSTPNICTALTVDLCSSKEETKGHEALENWMTDDAWSNTLEHYCKNSSGDGNPAQRLQVWNGYWRLRQLLSREHLTSTHQNQAVNDRQ